MWPGSQNWPSSDFRKTELCYLKKKQKNKFFSYTRITQELKVSKCLYIDRRQSFTSSIYPMSYMCRTSPLIEDEFDITDLDQLWKWSYFLWITTLRDTYNCFGTDCLMLWSSCDNTAIKLQESCFCSSCLHAAPWTLPRSLARAWCLSAPLIYSSDAKLNAQEARLSRCAQTDKSACFHHRVIHLLKQRQSLMLLANLLSDWPAATEQEDNQRSMKNLMLTRDEQKTAACLEECERVKRAHSEAL